MQKVRTVSFVFGIKGGVSLNRECHTSLNKLILISIQQRICYCFYYICEGSAKDAVLDIVLRNSFGGGRNLVAFLALLHRECFKEVP
jgi:hypothetical protein